MLFPKISAEEKLKREEEFREKYPEMYERHKWADPIVAQYPQFFVETRTIGVRKGWKKIIENLFSTLDFHISNLPLEMQGQIWVSQIKEKFGGLRVHFNHETKFMRGAIMMAEAMSESTCETCGADGKKHNVGGWVSTYCDPCHQVAIKENEARQQKYLDSKPKRKKK